VELQRQFGVIDATGEARIWLKNMKQGKRSVTEYWNEFRLVASKAELDDSTGGELLPRRDDHGTTERLGN